MENRTLRARVAQLIQKSRRALRLYSSAERSTERGAEYSELQVREWRTVNAELLRELNDAMQEHMAKNLSGRLFALRDHYLAAARTIEGEVHRRRKELVGVAESGDFVKAAVLSTELITSKARLQACQAAHNEIGLIIDRSRLAPPTIELTPDRVVPPDEAAVVEGGAKIIPLRQSAGRSR